MKNGLCSTIYRPATAALTILEQLHYTEFQSDVNMETLYAQFIIGATVIFVT